ncbi:MAG TPA: flagellar hook-associated protein 3 [Treponema sp.]|jgi:flagellar hook-associated protein 3 FlgL|nr:flagellar hook-associated protein 3 [Treponema sp.]
MHRISSQFNNNTTQRSLRSQEVRSALVQKQLGTQNRINALRDDPIAAGHLVRYKSYLSRVNQFQKNAQVMADNLQVREGYINQNLQIMQRVRELAVTGANGIYNTDDLKNMAVEVDELLKELVQNANAVGPDGNYLFSGTSTKTIAFDVVMGNVEGSGYPLISEVRYQGNVDINKIEVDENAYIPVDSSGNRTFWAEQQKLLSSRDLSMWQAREDSVISVDGQEVSITAGDNVYAVAAKINNSGAAVKASIDPVTHGLDLVTTDSRQLWLSDKSGSVLEDMGIIKDASQKPPYNIATGVSLSGGSLFDTVIALRDAMLRGDQEAIGGRVLGSIDAGMSNLSSRLAKLGSDFERAQVNVERDSKTALNVTNLVSREGDVDMTQAIMDLNMLDTVNQATLSNAGKMYSSTLLDYLR